MYQPKSIYTEIALEAIVRYIKEGKTIEPAKDDIPAELNYQLACFVSIHKREGTLRGCIGTLSPSRDNLYDEIVQNSISAATNDSRFDRLDNDELDDITVSVYVLSEPYRIYHFDDHDPLEKGLIVKKDGITKAVLLPNISGIDTTEEQIYKLKKKGGIEGIEDEHLEFYAFTADEYY